jgi:RNA polymerase sigma-70 factor (ECF subfamily)
MSTPSDEALVEAFRAGDLAAFDVLVLRWQRRIQGVIYRLLGSEDDAKDLCQETFLKAYRSLRGFKGQARFSSWLYQIAVNLCRDRMRRRRGRSFVSLDALGEDGAWPEALSRAAGPQQLAEQVSLRGLVQEAIAALPEEQREVIVLKEYQELTFLEISQALDVPLSTVKTRLYRGLVNLRGQLERQGVREVDALPAPQS